MHALVIGLALILPAPAIAQVADPAEVVAAERAFAADGLANGITASFTRWSQPDAVVIAGGRALTVREVFPPDVARPADEPPLAWWPTFAGIARSGDLGFTTGGVEVNGRRAGHYFTVWKRQPDGRWLWVYDGGTPATAEGQPGPDSNPRLLTEAAAPVASFETPMDEVRSTERAMAVGAQYDQKAVHLAVLAGDARLYVGTRPPAEGRAAFEAALDDWPERFEFSPMEGGGASEAGDLVWTYGPAAWKDDDGADRRGHYVRVWRKRGMDWELVLAQLIAAPPPAGG